MRGVPQDQPPGNRGVVRHCAFHALSRKDQFCSKNKAASPLTGFEELGAMVGFLAVAWEISSKNSVTMKEILCASLE